MHLAMDGTSTVVNESQTKATGKDMQVKLELEDQLRTISFAHATVNDVDTCTGDEKTKRIQTATMHKA